MDKQRGCKEIVALVKHKQTPEEARLYWSKDRGDGDCWPLFGNVLWKVGQEVHHSAAADEQVIAKVQIDTANFELRAASLQQGVILMGLQVVDEERRLSG